MDVAQISSSVTSAPTTVTSHSISPQPAAAALAAALDTAAALAAALTTPAAAATWLAVCDQPD